MRNRPKSMLVGVLSVTLIASLAPVAEAVEPSVVAGSEAAGPPAPAEVEEPFVLPAEIIAQAPLSALLDRFERLGGVMDTGICLAEQSVTILWYGKITRGFRAIVREAKSQGITVHVVKARFSDVELVTAMMTLVRHLRTTTDIEIEGYGPNSAYSGLALAGPELSTDAGQQATVTAAARALLPTGMTVEFRPRYVDPLPVFTTG
ncbi:hypothetical protein D1871_00790 [Nakamurella silvestris]|nr:hypothetical protein D1871_00790 [Nakamurella silvestris]